MYIPSPEELKGVLQVAFVVIVAIIMGVLLVRYLQITNAITAPELVVQQSFDDVPPDHWAYEEIELICSYGVTVGCSYDPPLYCPDRPATRAEMAVFAARLLELMRFK